MLKRILPWGGLLATVGIALMFAALNARQRVTVDFGFFTLYSVPLSFVAFGALITGMSIVLLAGVRADLRVRELLRQKSLCGPAPSTRF